MDTSVRALPHHYRYTEGKNGDLIKFTFSGETEKSWFLFFDNDWKLFSSVNQKPNCEVIIEDRFAWRIFTKGVKREEALDSSKIIGERELGLKIFDMVAVMA